MSVRTYNSSVRVGNWDEDIKLKEDIMKDYLERRERGQLLLQRAGGTGEPACVSISRDGIVHFGDRVMLVNKASPASERADCVLSLNMTADSLLSSDASAIPPGLSACPNATTSTRNLFTVMNPHDVPGDLPNTVPLRYNESFYLCLPSANGNQYLRSEAANFQSASKKARHNNVTLVDDPSFSTTFYVSFIDPTLRLEFEHLPVPANECVIITHQRTNANLAVEAAHQIRATAGWEFEVSCHTYLDSHGAEEDTNRWMFIMEVPGHGNSPSVSAPTSR